MAVIATIRAVCQENMELTNCFQTGTVSWLDALSCLFISTALFISSVKIGRLLDMARKNILSPIVAAGSSRTICCTDIPKLLKPLA